METQNFKRSLFVNLHREGKELTLVCFFLLLEERDKMSTTCSLFPPFEDPWPSCLLPFHSITDRREI